MYATGMYYSYLKLVQRYKFLNLGTHRADTLFIDPWLFFELKRGLRTKIFG